MKCIQIIRLGPPVLGQSDLNQIASNSQPVLTLMASTNGQNLPIGIADSGTGSGPRVISHNYGFFLTCNYSSYIVKQLISFGAPRPPGDTTFILIYVASICKYSCKYPCHMHFLIVSNWKTITPSRCNILGSYLKTPATPATPATRYLFMKSAA